MDSVKRVGSGSPHSRGRSGTTSMSVRPVLNTSSSGKSANVKRPEKKEPYGHRVVLTFTVVVACSKGSEEYFKLMDDLAKKNKKTLDAPKPQQFFHCEYVISPKQERTVVDIVSYGIAAKVFAENDSKVIKTWDDGAQVWIAWVNSHEIYINEENVLDLYNYTLDFKLWDSKDKVSPKARFDRPKAFRIPSSKDGSPGKGVANIVAKQSRSWLSLQPKGSATAVDLDQKTEEPDRFGELASPSPESINVPRINSSLGRLAGLDITGEEKKRINELKMRQARIKRQLNKTSNSESPAEKQKQQDGSQKGSKQSIPEAAQIRMVTVPIKYELLFSGLKEVTTRIENPTVNVHNMFVSVSISGKLLPEDMERKLNPLVITVKSLKDLPDTPIARNRLSAMCQPVYCAYKFLGQPMHKTISRSHGKDVHFQDVHVILAGTLDKGKFFEFLHSDGLAIEVHDRDRKLPDAAKSPLIFGDDEDDKKIANVGLVSSKNTVHNAFHDRQKAYDPFGIAKIQMGDLLQGRSTLTFTTVVNPCPLPDLLSNPNGTDTRNGLVGVIGSIDRPENPPIPTGDYLNAGTVIKVNVSLKHPLKWGDEMLPEQDEEFCPFSRVIYHFSYKNKQLLKTLENFVKEINLLALGFDQFDRQVAEAALATYKLSENQRGCTNLDVITGFHVIDGEFHLFVMEGLKNKAMKKLIDEIGFVKPDGDEFVRLLNDTSVGFQSRLYAELDIDLCKIRLHQPLKIILEQPLLYIRDLVPRNCFQCLVMIHHIIKANCLKDLCRNDLFPTHEMVISMSREFGIPITYQDFEEDHKKLPQEKDRFAEEDPSELDPEVRSPRWTPIDNTNREFDQMMIDRLKHPNQQPDYVSSNIFAVQEAGRRKRHVSRSMVYADIQGPSFNYSTQKLNSTELSKAALRRMLNEKDKDGRYAYKESFNSSMVAPVDEDEFYRNEDEEIKRRFRTEEGFIFPGPKTSMTSNVHPKQPPKARIEELKKQWRENTLHGHILRPTLDRQTWSWDLRHKDLNLYSKPPLELSHAPLSIHLPGVKAMQELLDRERRDISSWKSRVIVDNIDMKFHSVGSRTEHETVPRQVDFLGSILKDDPVKKALKHKPPQVPALSVVFYPEVDRDAREAGLKIPLGMSRSAKSPLINLQPGPYEELSFKMDKNTIPIPNPHHARFSQLKGSDFTTFLKDKEYLWTRRIHPLEDAERSNELFNEVAPPSAPKRRPDGRPLSTKEEEPPIIRKKSEYRTSYLPSLGARKRPAIFPRDQLGGLSHIIHKDASIELNLTADEVSELEKSKKKEPSKVVFKDDVQIVTPVTS